MFLRSNGTRNFPYEPNSLWYGHPFRVAVYSLITVTTSTVLVTNVLAKYFRSYDDKCHFAINS